MKEVILAKCPMCGSNPAVRKIKMGGKLRSMVHCTEVDCGFSSIGIDNWNTHCRWVELAQVEADTVDIHRSVQTALDGKYEEVPSPNVTDGYTMYYLGAYPSEQHAIIEKVISKHDKDCWKKIINTSQIFIGHPDEHGVHFVTLMVRENYYTTNGYCISLHKEEVREIEKAFNNPSEGKE
jgi:hypothetical protein